MTAPKPKGLGFKGLPPQSTALQSECLEPPLQDIERRIRITLHDQPALRAAVRARAQALLHQFTTLRAYLRCVARVHQNGRSASFCRFAERHADELTPCHVQNAFAHPAALAHCLWLKLFKHNHLVGVDPLPAALVREIAPSIGYPLMNMRQCLFPMPVLIPLCAVLAASFNF